MKKKISGRFNNQENSFYPPAKVRRYRQGRRCLICKKKLSMYNLFKICHVCVQEELENDSIPKKYYDDPVNRS